MASSSKKKIIIIGSGFGGLSAACLLAKKGHEVIVYEKNVHHGGRANILTEQGFMFDMGPSWYMMPDVFEHFFGLMGERVDDHLNLVRLKPSYRIFREGRAEHHDIVSDREAMIAFFESREAGAGEKLRAHLDSAAYQYGVAKKEFMYKNYNSLWDLFTKRMLVEGRKLPLFKSIEGIINKLFSDELLRQILLYQMVFLGTSPRQTPGIYSLMNHVDIDGGIYYPQGGIYELVKALVRMAEKNGVVFHTNTPVEKILIDRAPGAPVGSGVVRGVRLQSGEEVYADIVISNADIAFTDMKLTPVPYNIHPASWWDKKRLTPSAFLIYLGVTGRVPQLEHHNLLFAETWHENMSDVFDKKVWPEQPSVYICCSSKTDTTVAPADHENIFILVPIAYDLRADDAFLNSYADKILVHIEKEIGIEDFQKRIVFKKIYATDDFERDYNAYKGNALGGLAHNLMQTAFFRPNNIHPRVKNLFYTGAGTNPGIGVPICVISGELVYKRIEGIDNPEPLTSL